MSVLNLFNLEGKVALVTGGTHGIGMACGMTLGQAGAKVCVNDIDEEKLANAKKEYAEAGIDVYTLVFDVTDEADVDRGISQIEAEVGDIDILVNNAGIAGDTVKTWDYPVEEWQRVLDIDLTGVFLCCKAVVPGMIARNYGRIVNVASIAGKEGNPNASAYSAAKAGVIALTKSLGKELADYDIAVNSVTPAAAKTRIFEQISQEHIDYMLSKIPRGRFVKVEEIAALIAWLASKDCSFSTGAVFDISGGRATY